MLVAHRTAELLHHLPHLLELLHEAVHLCDIDTRALRNPALTGRIDEIRIRSLLRRHGLDDRLYLIHLLLGIVCIDVTEPRHTRQQLHDTAEAAELLHLLHLIHEVVVVELATGDLSHGLLRLVLIDVLLRLLDKGKHIAHAEDTARHTIRIELLEVVELLTHT